MRILVTNDDGVFSPGLCALAEAASRFGEVRIVAPDVEQSSMAHAITSSRPLLQRRARVGQFDAWRVNGTPADCVALGTHLWEKVDLVFSGINLGLNVGNSMWHSGTLAAAKQAALLGFRGIAFSAPETGDEPDYGPLRSYLDTVIREAISRPELKLVNVNFPSKPRGVQWTSQSVRHYDGRVVPAKDPMGREHFWFVPVPIEAPEPGTDRWAVQEGLVSVTPLRLDLTDHEALGRLQAA
ncbi:5'/3'-nucleotidase SurE [Chondromyces apiculatus]|uniref:5'-nucleotidase SurE n=1 Tax=Chondromyces apiculatus DSM 436 TaxID=1192034 RepID=A0A017T8V2_9BACT|nr:5'/3'-nucleotidase SurE [Chondromyces apiculatus]EYF05659.1 5-nucleotidase SurE [Chondromyces apiculatus DSM 436]